MASVLIATASVSYELERVSDVPLDMCSAQAHVRFGSKADMCGAKRHVRFTPESGHSRAMNGLLDDPASSKPRYCGAWKEGP
jgi:hypothetical protein